MGTYVMKYNNMLIIIVATKWLIVAFPSSALGDYKNFKTWLKY